MVIEDEGRALSQLSSISYSRLANYWRMMEERSDRRFFSPNTRFEDVVSLYVLDRKLRDLIFTAIQDIEIALRTRVVHHFSMKFGAFWFMDKSLFKDEAIYVRCYDSTVKELGRSREDFILDYFIRYDSPPYPPVWKTFEVVSFGTLSKLYCNMRDVEVKKRVASDFKLPHYIFLASWIKCTSVLRNSCAHHARIWNRRFPLIPKMPSSLPLPWIEKINFNPVKLYPHLCYLCYLDMSVNPNGGFKKELLQLLNSISSSTLRLMGFPRNWSYEKLWRCN